MPISEERMIYRVGKSSLAITLPQNWLRYFGLTAGDSVQLTGNGDLIIRPRKRQENAEISQEIKGKKLKDYRE
jgi:antitoxin component of MazEF toxin-antitoxin module